MASDLADCWTLEEVHALAATRLHDDTRWMIDGGAGAGGAIRGNAAAFEKWRLRPRVLSGVASVDPGVDLLGRRATAPLMFAPSGLHGMAHPEGELATARAARAAGLPMVLSTVASVAVETVARAAGDLWFQLYWGADRSETRALVARAEAAGARALCLTLDMPTRPWLGGAMRAAVRAIAHVQPAHGRTRGGHLDRDAAWDHDATLRWEDLAWLRSLGGIKLVLKGIMTGEDAALAVEHGADAIIVSNHGGRVLERGQATVEVLPEIVDAVAGRCEVYLDGGVRSGSDIAVALALGARAVLIGRPVQWGLAAGGSDGVARVIELLTGEFRSVMTMLGAATPAALGRQHLAYRNR